MQNQIIRSGVADLLIPAAHGAVTGFDFFLDVEEDEMIVEFDFQGVAIATGVGPITGGFLLDGVAVAGGPVFNKTVVAADAVPISFHWSQKVTKGSHRVQLALGDATAGVLDSSAFPQVLTVRRYSNSLALSRHAIEKRVGLV